MGEEMRGEEKEMRGEGREGEERSRASYETLPALWMKVLPSLHRGFFSSPFSIYYITLS